MPKDDKPGRLWFRGFEPPAANYFRMPTEWIDICANMKSLAELKVVQYILRHTWGYQEYGLKKHITIDEFIRGRRRRDGTRIDKGTGLAEQSVRNGLAEALTHGLIEEFVDAADRARVKKYYGLRMHHEVGADQLPVAEPDFLPRGAGVQDLDPGPQKLGVQDLDPRGPRFRPRTKELTQEITSPDDDEMPARRKNAAGMRGAQPHAPRLAVPLNGLSKLLHEFGISPEVAVELTQTYPADHVVAELDFTRWLVETRSSLVERNPAGFLVRAIQGAYPAPPGYKTPAQRHAEEQHRTAMTDGEAAARRDAEEAYARARQVAQERLREQYPPQAIPGTTLTTVEAWAQTLQDLATEVTGPIFHMWLKPTQLLTCDAQQAVVAVPSQYHAEQLGERRLDERLAHALRRIVGSQVTCQLVSLADLQREDAHDTDAHIPTEHPSSHSNCIERQAPSV